MIKDIIQEATHDREKSPHRSASNTAVDKVKDYIKRQIILGTLKAGDRIPTENELCRLLDVSRGSVREAMKILEALSIIRIIRGDGTYISEVKNMQSMESILMKVILSDTTIVELTEFREEIEFSVINLASRNATEEEVRLLKQIVEETHRCAAENPCDPVRLYDLDNKFHEVLGKATHNLLIQEMYSFAHELIAPMLLKNYEIGQSGELTAQTHTAALEAIESGDFRMMGFAVKKINEVWMKSYYGNKKGSSLLDRELLNDIVMNTR